VCSRLSDNLFCKKITWGRLEGAGLQVTIPSFTAQDWRCGRGPGQSKQLALVLRRPRWPSEMPDYLDTKMTAKLARGADAFGSAPPR
jgi:hypothetical protein